EWHVIEEAEDTTETVVAGFQTEADARLFVQAVKSQAALLAACKLAEEALSGAVTSHSAGCAAVRVFGEPCDCWIADRQKALIALRAVIAQAEPPAPEEEEAVR